MPSPLTEILKGIPGAVFQFRHEADGRMRLSYASEGFRALFGIPPDEAVTDMNRFWDRIHPEDLRPLRESIRRTIETFQPGQHDFRVRHRDGTVKWVRGQAVPQARDQGAGSTWNGLLTDITEQKRMEEGLRQSEARYRIVADNTSDWEFWVSPEGKFLYTSPSCEGITGHRAEEFTAHPGLLIEIMHPEDRPRFAAHLREADQQRKPGRVEFRIQHPSKGWRWIDHRCQPAFDANGKFVGIRGSNHDITERMEIHVALQEERDFARNLIETSPLLIVVLDPAGRVLRINTSMEQISGWRRDEVAGKDWAANFLPRLERTRGRRVLWTVAYDIPVMNHLDTLVNRQGAERMIEWSNLPLKGHGGETIGLLCVGQDVTERHEAEAAVRESEERFHRLFTGSPDAIFLANHSGRVIDANPKACEMLGYSHSELDGRAIRDFAIGLRARTGARSPPMTEVMYRRKDGTLFPVEVSIAHLRLKEELVEMAIVRDISERRQAEDALRAHREQLRSLMAQLAQVEEHERQRIATSLHDGVGQLLMVAKLKLQELEHAARPGDPVGAESLRRREAGVTKDIAIVPPQSRRRRDSAPTKNNPHRPPLQASLQDIRKLLEQAVGETRQLTTDLSPPVLHQLGFDAAMNWLAGELHRVLGLRVRVRNDRLPHPLDPRVRSILFRNIRELLTNAAKHARVTEAIVSVRRHGAHLRVIVEDCGAGFDPANIRPASDEGGHFGLFSIRERMESLGGKFTIRSAPGQGTRATLTVPLLKVRKRRVKERR